MKKRARRIWQLAGLGLLGVAMLFSLMLPEEFLMESEPERVEISILTRQTDGTIWSVARQGMEQAAEDLGAELRFLTLRSPNDSAEQLELLYREAELHVDGAVIVPADCRALEECLKEWKAFPVVTMESRVEGAKAFIGPDNQQAGEQLARQVVQDLPSKGVALLVRSCAESTGVAQRMDAAKRVLEQAGFKVCTAENGLQQMTEPADAVLCFDMQSLFQVEKMQGSDEPMPRVYAAGATSAAVSRLETGEISALAAWSEYAQGYLALKQAVCAARKETVETCVLPVTVVQEGETYEPDHQKLLYPVSH